MTLVISELSEFGIAMVADSAVTVKERTPSGDIIHRVLNGAQKLQVIPPLSAGISMWGLGTILTPVGSVSTDVWIADFIQRHTDIQSVDEFANELARELHQVVGNAKKAMGFHLAGYVERHGRRLPTLYHVRNVDGPYGRFRFHDFIPGHDYPPREIAEEKDRRSLRNGDFGPYAVLSDTVNKVLPHIRGSMKLGIPHPSLGGRLAYLAAWVKFISDLYASAGEMRTIGGSIASLGITPEGQVLSYPT